MIEEDQIDFELLEKLKSLRNLSYEDDLILAKLYYKCYKILKNLKKLEPEIKSKIDDLKINENLERELIEYLNTEYGKYYLGLRIKDLVKGNTKDINNLIDLFFENFDNKF